jgi:membrane associated rhomboid family serine protease
MSSPPALRDTWKFRAGALTILLGLMWLVWLLDAVTPGPGSAAGIGIVPRTTVGLRAIPAAPFIHAGFDHILSNSIPLAVLGSLIVISGTMDLLFVVLVSGLVGGLGTWLFGSGDRQHVGASGLVFGFIGYLVFRVAFDRRIVPGLITLLVAVLYGGVLLASILPQPAISWSGHFFGFLGGIAAARLRHSARPVDGV